MRAPEWYQQDGKFLRSAVLARFPCSQNKDTIKNFCDVSFTGVEDNNEVKCKKCSDNARFFFFNLEYTAENPLARKFSCGKLELTTNVRWENSWLLFGVRSVGSSPTAFRTQKETRLHLSSTGRISECVSWTSSRGSRCPFLRLSWKMAAIVSKFMKNRSSRVSPMQTSKSYWQRRAPPAVKSLCSRVRVAEAPLALFLFWSGPSLCPPAKGYSPVGLPPPPVLWRGVTLMCSQCFLSLVPRRSMLPIPLLPLSLVANVLSICGQDAHLAPTAVSLLIAPCVTPTLSLICLASNGCSSGGKLTP